MVSSGDRESSVHHGQVFSLGFLAMLISSLVTRLTNEAVRSLEMLLRAKRVPF